MIGYLILSRCVYSTQIKSQNAIHCVYLKFVPYLVWLGCWSSLQVNKQLSYGIILPFRSETYPRIWFRLYISFTSGSYLVVVTESERVGSFLGHPIFKITSLKVLPCDHSLKNSPEEQVNNSVHKFSVEYISSNDGSQNLNALYRFWQKKMETEFSRLLSVAEKTTGLYFSYEVNLTLR